MRLLNLKETARFLNISYSTLMSLIRENKIPYKVIKKGKRKRLIRFDETELIKWLNSNLQKQVKCEGVKKTE